MKTGIMEQSYPMGMAIQKLISIDDALVRLWRMGLRPSKAIKNGSGYKSKHGKLSRIKKKKPKKNNQPKNTHTQKKKTKPKKKDLTDLQFGYNKIRVKIR